MHSASDIFCLKELKEGDTNGTQLFSVNGSSQLTTLGRRKYVYNGSCSFQYGSPAAEENILPEIVVKAENIENEDKINDDSETPGHCKDHLELMTLSKSDPSAVSEGIENDITIHCSKTSEPESKMSLSHAEGDMREGLTVSQSAIARNPLTGAGMDPAAH
ncbi:hypothetical protein D910_11030 [Dendroctonus ponderosae]